MKRLILAVTAALCLATLFITPRAAAADDGEFELSVFAGYRYGGDFEEDFDDEFFDNQEIEDSEVYGAIASIPINRSFHVDVYYSRQDSELQFDGGILQPDVEIADVELSYLQAGMTWQWRPGQVRPFVGASLGLARLDPDLPGVDAETRLAGGIYGGTKLFFSDHVGLRLEGRVNWIDLYDYEYEDRRFGRRYREDDAFYQVDLTAGLLFSF